jgi:HSP20 family protein
MTASFFEKLTGAEINEEPQPLTEKVEKKIKKASPPELKKEIKKEPLIKKESLEMPKAKKMKTKLIKKEPENPTEIKVEEEKEKGWLEEVEGEEGQLTIDVYQTESEIVIKSTIAGVNPEDVDISITNDMVTIRGKRTKDETINTENYYYQELYWGAFSRSVILPVEVDADRAKATIKNGILSIKLPKSEKVKTKKINVRAEE